MRRALSQVIARHDALHAIFSPDGEFLAIMPADDLTIPLYDLSDRLQSEREAESTTLIAQQAAKVFDLSRGPLVRACFIKLEPEHHLLVLTIHHTVFDGWSSSILLQELHACYMGEQLGVKPELPEAVQLGCYVQWQADQEESSENREAEAYWLERYSGAVPGLE